MRPRGVRCRLRGVATVLAALMIATGCSSEGSGGNPSPPSAAGSGGTASAGGPASSATAAGMEGAPAEGTCWAVPPAKATMPGYWFDGSPRVPCTQRHTTETVKVRALPEPTVAAAKVFGDECIQRVLQYVEVSPDVWIPWRAVLLLPSRAQVAQGASWARCDVAFPGDTTGTRSTWHTYSARDVLDKHHDDLWPCLARDPEAVRAQPYLSCTRPHGFEATGQTLALFRLDRYPSPKKLRAEGAACQDGLTEQDQSRGVAVKGVWDPPAWLENGGLYGACWFYREDGRPLPPR